MVSLQGWQFVPDSRKDKFLVIVIVSIIFHLLFVVAAFIYPLLHKPKAVEVPVFTLVPLEKPKVVVRKPKVQPPPKPPEKKPEPKPEAPKLTEKPEKPKPPEEKPVEVKEEPQKEEPKEVVQEEVKDLQPRMVMEDLTDPRLKFWLRRVQRKIQSLWNPPRGFGVLGSAEVHINFTVERQGGVKNITVATSSGNSALDEEGKRTLMRVGSLPPIPPNYQDKDELAITFILPYIGD